MNILLTGQAEARLLALERKQARIDDRLRALRRDVVAVQQGIWDAWSDFRARGVQAPVVATHPATVSGCGTVLLPDTLNGVDSLYGPVALAWDGTNWTGCHAGLSYPATGATFALHYRFTAATGGLDVSWLGNGLLQPIASTCATATNENNIALSGSGLICAPFSRTYLVNSSSALALKTLYQNTFPQTVTVSP